MQLVLKYLNIAARVAAAPTTERAAGFTANVAANAPPTAALRPWGAETSAAAIDCSGETIAPAKTDPGRACQARQMIELIRRLDEEAV